MIISQPITLGLTSPQGKCSEHEMEALGDFGLFDLMRVIYSKSQFYSVMYCNCTNHLSLLGFCEDMSTSNPVCR